MDNERPWFQKPRALKTLPVKFFMRITLNEEFKPVLADIGAFHPGAKIEGVESCQLDTNREGVARLTLVIVLDSKSAPVSALPVARSPLTTREEIINLMKDI